MKIETKPEGAEKPTSVDSVDAGTGARRESHGEWAVRNSPWARDMAASQVSPSSSSSSNDSREGKADAKPRPRERPGFRGGAPGRVPNTGAHAREAAYEGRAEGAYERPPYTTTPREPPYQRPAYTPPPREPAYQRPAYAPPPHEAAYEKPPESPHAGNVGKKPPKGATVETFGAAALLFAANLAVYLKLDRKAFLKSAATAFDYITSENSKRKGVSTEGEEPRAPSAPKPGDT